ncbi:putative nicotinate-nucleotide pyrophosphorylase [Andreesenia angusta]|uniref:Probable nicotinate-nucleotide pyrophosphorylase [carboxylating] n=1 Tax=Andreesenia angusta TaxID=39480 RepID=A0A1S1V4E2_9FIRM|nr:carboxylating nicotinate-nucleotide diphosphorylase [Andreesenia angusta]OHW61561.1 putative nicotinate-nucleotide pyrophosphorylase [Andreesenia angusta]
MLNKLAVNKIIEVAILEDINGIDNTNDYLLDRESMGEASVIFKEFGIVSGLDVLKWVFEMVDEEIEVEFKKSDGDIVQSGEEVAVIKGRLISILKGERVALNFLQRMSGISTMGYTLSSLVEDYPVRISDTRKTTPGLRLLEKYAVKISGCYNHRYSLSDSVMIKDNHIKAVGSIEEAVKRVRAEVSHTITVEVEVESLDQLKEALKAKADIIMLDNMTLEDMRMAVSINKGRAVLEASGNISEENIVNIAQTGVDIISVGALTHSAKSIDISLNIV